MNECLGVKGVNGKDIYLVEPQYGKSQALLANEVKP